MAPELLLQGRASRASDVYAMGVLLWELATGQRAFAQIPKAMLGAAVVRDQARPEWPEGSSCVHSVAAAATAAVHDVHPPLPYRQITQACWASDPNDRPSFAEISIALEHLLHQEQQRIAELTALSQQQQQPQPQQPGQASTPVPLGPTQQQADDHTREAATAAVAAAATAAVAAVGTRVAYDALQSSTAAGAQASSSTEMHSAVEDRSTSMFHSIASTVQQQQQQQQNSGSNNSMSTPTLQQQPRDSSIPDLQPGAAADVAAVMYPEPAAAGFLAALEAVKQQGSLPSPEAAAIPQQLAFGSSYLADPAAAAAARSGLQEQSQQQFVVNACQPLTAGAVPVAAAPVTSSTAGRSNMSAAAAPAAAVAGSPSASPFDMLKDQAWNGSGTFG